MLDDPLGPQAVTQVENVWQCPELECRIAQKHEHPLPVVRSSKYVPPFWCTIADCDGRPGPHVHEGINEWLDVAPGANPRSEVPPRDCPDCDYSRDEHRSAGRPTAPPGSADDCSFTQEDL